MALLIVEYYLWNVAIHTFIYIYVHMCRWERRHSSKARIITFFFPFIALKENGSSHVEMVRYWNISVISDDGEGMRWGMLSVLLYYQHWCSFMVSAICEPPERLMLCNVSLFFQGTHFNCTVNGCYGDEGYLFEVQA